MSPLGDIEDICCHCVRDCVATKRLEAIRLRDLGNDEFLPVGECLENLHQALQLARELGDLLLQAQILCDLGDIDREGDRMSYYSEALQLDEEITDKHPPRDGFLGARIFYGLGSVDEKNSISHYERALERLLFVDSDDKVYHLESRIWCARAVVEENSDHFSQAITWASFCRDDFLDAQIDYNWGNLLAKVDGEVTEDSIKLYAKALRKIQDINPKSREVIHLERQIWVALGPDIDEQTIKRYQQQEDLRQKESLKKIITIWNAS